MRKMMIFSAMAIAAIPAVAANAEMPHEHHQAMMHAPVIELFITGSAEASPDMASITAAVQTRAPVAADAMAQNARQMQQVIAMLKGRGIADRDIQTSSISLGQDYEYGSSGQKFKGYVANNSVSVKLRNLSAAGQILDGLVAAGATNINGPYFTVDDDSQLLAAARLDALKQAAALSDFYAKNSGYARAVLVSLNEGGGSVEPVYGIRRKGELASDAAAVTPVEAGEISRSVTINVRYRLEN